MLKVTYEKLHTSHCSVSDVVRKVKIDNLKPAFNSDFLEVATFEGFGWQAIVKKGQHKIGDEVIFIPPESVLPFELSEALGVTGYLAKGRVKVARLRKNLSEGLVTPVEITEEYLPYILKWEDPPTVGMSGLQLPKYACPPEFETFYKMENLMNVPELFSIGEPIWYSEKMHGTNCRFGNLKHPETSEYELFVGTHHTVRKESDGDIYWECVKKITNNIKAELPKDYVFYNEIYGRGVQDIAYNTEPQARVFALLHQHNYQSLDLMISMCDELNIPRINIYPDVFQGIEWARQIANTPSQMPEYSGLREGIVIVSQLNPNKMAKVIGVEYQLRKGGTERH